MKKFLLYAFIFFLFIFVSCHLEKKEAISRPNVIIFFIDDLGWKDISSYGSTFYETPHIDSLINSGVKFTQAYSASPVCSPSRVALMTGKAPQRLGITQWIPNNSKLALPKKENIISKAFKQNGYVTGYIGKWHLGKNNFLQAYGFDWQFAVNKAGQPGSYYYPYKDKNKNRGYYTNVPNLEKKAEKNYLTDRLTDGALNFISKSSKKPFFLVISHYAVHTPIQEDKELVTKYKMKKEKIYPFLKKHPLAKRDKKTVSRLRQDDIKYASMVENLDKNVGRVLNKLKKEKILENTIIIFASDNGGLSDFTIQRNRPGYTSNNPLKKGKGWTYEGGIRVPFIISWKSQLKKATSNTPTITMDIYPTLLELCSIPLNRKQHLDGISLKNILFTKKENPQEQRFLAWVYPHKHRSSGHKPSAALREGNWKIIYFFDNKKVELYDLANDIGEKNDLVNESRIKKNLLKKLSQWLKETKSPLQINVDAF